MCRSLAVGLVLLAVTPRATAQPPNASIGEAVPGYTGEVVDEVPNGGPEDVDRAARAAEKAQRSWARLAPNERARILHQAADHTLTHCD